jgi:vacuolar-type H+-ATPase subunit F/Vma7
MKLVSFQASRLPSLPVILLIPDTGHLTPIKENSMHKTILLIATHDTKEEEARFLKSCIEANGFEVLVMDTGILAPPKEHVDISQNEVADCAGTPLAEALARGDKR